MFQEIAIKGGQDQFGQRSFGLQLHNQSMLGKRVMRSDEPLPFDFRTGDSRYQTYLDTSDYISANGYLPQKLLTRAFNHMEQEMAVAKKLPLAMVKKRPPAPVIDKRLDFQVDQYYRKIVRPRQTLLDSEAIALQQLKTANGLSDTSLMQVPFAPDRTDMIYQQLQTQMLQAEMLRSVGNKLNKTMDLSGEFAGLSAIGQNEGDYQQLLDESGDAQEDQFGLFYGVGSMLNNGYVGLKRLITRENQQMNATAQTQYSNNVSRAQTEFNQSHVYNQLNNALLSTRNSARNRPLSGMNVIEEQKLEESLPEIPQQQQQQIQQQEAPKPLPIQEEVKGEVPAQPEATGKSGLSQNLWRRILSKKAGITSFPTDDIVYEDKYTKNGPLTFKELQKEILEEPSKADIEEFFRKKGLLVDQYSQDSPQTPVRPVANMVVANVGARLIQKSTSDIDQTNILGLQQIQKDVNELRKFVKDNEKSEQFNNGDGLAFIKNKAVMDSKRVRGMAQRSSVSLKQLSKLLGLGALVYTATNGNEVMQKLNVNKTNAMQYISDYSAKFDYNVLSALNQSKYGFKPDESVQSLQQNQTLNSASDINQTVMSDRQIQYKEAVRQRQAQIEDLSHRLDVALTNLREQDDAIVRIESASEEQIASLNRATDTLMNELDEAVKTVTELEREIAGSRQKISEQQDIIENYKYNEEGLGYYIPDGAKTWANENFKGTISTLSSVKNIIRNSYYASKALKTAVGTVAMTAKFGPKAGAAYAVYDLGTEVVDAIF